MNNSPSRGRARIGVLVPFTNTNLEPDLALLRPTGISFHFARLGGYDADEIPDAGQMAGLGTADIEAPLKLLMGVRPDIVMYGCTSATLTHGPAFDRKLADQIKAQSGAQTITAAGALLGALAALGVKQYAFGSPYVPQINDLAIAFLKTGGHECVSRADMKEDLGNYGQGELPPEAVYDLARRADSDRAQAIVLSCTDMRSLEVAGRLEQELGKAVITSNQAMMYQAQKILGLKDSIKGFGRLLEMT